MKNLLLLLLCSCNIKKELKNFDTTAWKSDRNGCEGKREKLQKDLESIRKDLKGFSQTDIVSALGKPDYQTLSERGQKFFIYFLEKGKQCESLDSVSQARTLVIRFNAVELAAEINYETGKPKLP
jgi:hypothetical protein